MDDDLLFKNYVYTRIYFLIGHFDVLRKAYENHKEYFDKIWAKTKDCIYDLGNEIHLLDFQMQDCGYPKWKINTIDQDCEHFEIQIEKLKNQMFQMLADY